MTVAQWIPPGFDSDAEFQLAEDVIYDHARIVGRTDTMERPEWLRMRKMGIGASDAAPVLGLSPWGSPVSVWVDKTTDEVSKEETERQKWGRRMELPILLGVAEDTGIPVRQFPFMVQSKEWPWMTANLDGISPRSNVEVKNVDRWMADEWDDGAVPMHYMIQGQHSNAVTGHEGTHFFPLIGGNDPRPIYVERNDTLIEKLVESERAFWDLVESLQMPEIDGSKATARALAAAFGNPVAESSIELPAQAVELVEQRWAMKDQIKEIQAEIDVIENTLKLWLGNAEIGIVNGITVFTWKKISKKGYFVEPTSYRGQHYSKTPRGKKGTPR